MVGGLELVVILEYVLVDGEYDEVRVVVINLERCCDLLFYCFCLFVFVGFDYVCCWIGFGVLFCFIEN